VEAENARIAVQEERWTLRKPDYGHGRKTDAREAKKIVGEKRRPLGKPKKSVGKKDGRPGS
jgi:hypothetical protein